MKTNIERAKEGLAKCKIREKEIKDKETSRGVVKQAGGMGGVIKIIDELLEEDPKFLDDELLSQYVSLKKRWYREI